MSLPTDPPTDPDRAAHWQLVAPELAEDRAHLEQLGRALLLEVVRGAGRVLTGPVEMTSCDPVVFVHLEGADGVLHQQPVPTGSPLAGDRQGAAPDAVLVRWEAPAGDPARDPEPVLGYADPVEPGRVRGDLAGVDTLNGGTVLFRHGIPGAVTVRAYTDQDEPVGYLVAAGTDVGEHQVQVAAGTAYLLAVTDTEPVE